MGDKTFDLWLDDSVYLEIQVHSVKGKVVNFGVQLLYYYNGTVYQIARYDSKHGTPHKHKNYLKGRKVTWFYGKSNEEVLNLAMEDLKENYERYIEIYRQNKIHG